MIMPAVIDSIGNPGILAGGVAVVFVKVLAKVSVSSNVLVSV